MRVATGNWQQILLSVIMQESKKNAQAAVCVTERWANGGFMFSISSVGGGFYTALVNVTELGLLSLCLAPLVLISRCGLI